MAGKRTLTPAMLAHLRAIATLGGRSTARKYGGWAAPHHTRKARNITKSSLPRGLRTTTAGAPLSNLAPRLPSTTSNLPRTLLTTTGGTARSSSSKRKAKQ